MIVSYPRSAASWVARLIGALLYPDDDLRWLNLPYLESVYFSYEMERQKDLPRRIIMTHLRPCDIANSLVKARCLFIYVRRRAREVFKSYFLCHGTCTYLPTLSIHEFYEQFMSGTLCYGNYFEHTTEWKKTANDISGITVENQRGLEQLCSALGKDRYDLKGALDKYPSTSSAYNSLHPIVEEKLHEFDLNDIVQELQTLTLNDLSYVEPYERSFLSRNDDVIAIRMAKAANHLEKMLLDRKILSLSQCLAARLNSQSVDHIKVLLHALRTADADTVSETERCVANLMPELVNELLVLEKPV